MNFSHTVIHSVLAREKKTFLVKDQKLPATQNRTRLRTGSESKKEI